MAEESRTLFQGRVVLITGAGTGIGRGMALAFAREGASIALAGRRKEPLEATAAEIQKLGAKAAVIKTDVSNAADCQTLALECVLRLGDLHILINNAGNATFGALDQTADEDISSMLDVNLRGVMLMSKYAIPELIKHRDGSASILNIGTSAALTVVKNFSVYSSVKAALIHFTNCMALELAEHRVRVNCINPGVVETPIFETMMPAASIPAAMANFASQTPLGRVGQPQDIADAALFLCSRKASWITGASLTVDGGISLT